MNSNQSRLPDFNNSFCVTMALTRARRENTAAFWQQISMFVTRSDRKIVSSYENVTECFARLSSRMLDACLVVYIRQKASHCSNRTVMNVTIKQNVNNIGQISSPAKKYVCNGNTMYIRPRNSVSLQYLHYWNEIINFGNMMLLAKFFTVTLTWCNMCEFLS